MKNKIITIYELIGFIKDGKAPKQIKYDDEIYCWNDEYKSYLNEDRWDLFYKYRNISKILNNMVEILPEENNEWEDIEELSLTPKDISLTDVVLENRGIINQLIKNQKYLKEKLEGKDD